MKIFLFISSCVLLSPAFAAEWQDTVQLKEVIKNSSVELSSVEVKSPTFFRTVQNETNTIDKLLQESNSIYIKNYGQRGLASIAYRGTSAAQNDFYWNGVKINSPFSGQVDCSLLPIDNNLQFAISPNSNAIGAQIKLDDVNKLKGEKAMGLQLFSKYSTINAFDISASLQTKWKGFYTTSNIYHHNAKNDFIIPDVTVKDGTKRQTNAAVSQLSAKTTWGYNWKGRNDISVSAWWMQSNRQLTPVLTKPSSLEKQLDKSLRLIAKYVGGKKNYAWGATTSYLYDYLNYQNPEIKLTSLSSSYVSRNDVYGKGFFLNKHIETELGLKYDFESAKSDGFDKSVHRNIFEIREHIGYTNKRGIIATDVFVYETVFNNSVIPSGKISARFTTNESYLKQFSITVSAARTLRIPSMNDLYWTQAGNPNLQPERGWKGEVNLGKSITEYVNLKLNGYGQYVQDWILWHPVTANFWKPENLKKVYGYGLEAEGTFGQISSSNKKWFAYLHTNYSWNRMINLENISANDASKNKQIIYVPFHKANASIIGGWKGFIASFDASYTGRIFTSTDNTAFLPGFLLFDTHLSKQFSIKQQAITLSFAAYNLANKIYQTVPQRAMPGRYFEFSLKLNMQG